MEVHKKFNLSRANMGLKARVVERHNETHKELNDELKVKWIAMIDGEKKSGIN